MKAMAIINLIWAPVILVFILIAGANENAFSESMTIILGLVMLLGFIHTTVFSIVALIKSKTTNTNQEIFELKKWKEIGILSEEEFEAKAIELLKK